MILGCRGWHRVSPGGGGDGDLLRGGTGALFCGCEDRAEAVDG